jgi:hypothetical protein
MSYRTYRTYPTYPLLDISRESRHCKALNLLTPSLTQPEPTCWTIHLAARHPGRAVVALLAIIFGLFALHALGEHSWLALAIAGGILFASIGEFFFPVTYRLDSAGAQAQLLGTRRCFPWARVRRVYLRRSGIQLSPFSRENWLDQYRGITLRSDDPAALLAQIRLWLQHTGVTAEIIEES